MKQLLLYITLFFTLYVNAQCWQEVSVGQYHFVAVKTDGTLWTWGSNDSGQLGNGTGVNSIEPIQVSADTNWLHVQAGAVHNVAIKADGSMWAWGSNEVGQVGVASISSVIPLPVQVGTDTDWNMVSSSGYTTMAIKNNGTLWGWGNNSSGQLGNNTFINRYAPVQIGTATNWKSVSSSDYHNSAIKTNGTLWTWGSNSSGQLGNMFFSVPFYVPTQIGVETDWKVTSAGPENTVALKNDGTLWAWGWNADGQLGNGTTTSVAVATPIGTDTDWQIVSSGLWIMLAIKADGTLWGAGNNGNGQLGNGTQTSVIGLDRVNSDSNWATISTNGYITAATKTDGSLYTWGWNEGQILGNGITDDYVLSPAQVACRPTANIKPIQGNTLTVYPNPAKTTVTIASTFGETIKSITVTDLCGKTVIQQNTASNLIDVEQLPSGMYFLKVSTGAGQQILKITKN